MLLAVPSQPRVCQFQRYRASFRPWREENAWVVACTGWNPLSSSLNSNQIATL